MINKCLRPEALYKRRVFKCKYCGHESIITGLAIGPIVPCSNCGKLPHIKERKKGKPCDWYSQTVKCKNCGAERTIYLHFKGANPDLGPCIKCGKKSYELVKK